MRRPVALVIALLTAALLAIAPAAAQDELDITAVAYRDLPPGAPLRVRLLDDSDLNQQVRDLIVGELAAAGHAIAEDAVFVLQVETQTSSEAEADPSLGSFEAGTAGAELRMNLWSTREDSLLQGRQGGVAGPSVYRIALGLYDGRDGRYYWRGSVGTVLDEANAAGASRNMVPALLAHFGRSAPEAPGPE